MPTIALPFRWDTPQPSPNTLFVPSDVLCAVHILLTVSGLSTLPDPTATTKRRRSSAEESKPPAGYRFVEAGIGGFTGCSSQVVPSHGLSVVEFDLTVRVNQVSANPLGHNRQRIIQGKPADLMLGKEICGKLLKRAPGYGFCCGGQNGETKR